MKNQIILQSHQQNNEHTFNKVPKFLFTNPNYNHISNDAKLLYSLLLSRHSLSMKNKAAFTDERGIYIIFTREQMAAQLHCSRQKSARLVCELLLIGLITEKRVGLSKANRIYLQDVQSHEERATCSISASSHEPEPPIETDRNTYKHPDVMIRYHQDVTPCNTSKNDYSEIDHSYSSFKVDHLESINQDQESNDCAFDPIDEEPKITPQEKRTENNSMAKKQKQNHFEVLEQVKEQIDFDDYYSCACEDTINLIECILSIMVEVYTSTKTTMRINKENIAIDFVRWQFAKINRVSIDYVLESLAIVSPDIRDLRAYLRTALYNSPDTAELYFQQSTDSYCKR